MAERDIELDAMTLLQMHEEEYTSSWENLMSKKEGEMTFDDVHAFIASGAVLHEYKLKTIRSDDSKWLWASDEISLDDQEKKFKLDNDGWAEAIYSLGPNGNCLGALKLMSRMRKWTRSRKAEIENMVLQHSLNLVNYGEEYLTKRINKNNSMDKTLLRSMKVIQNHAALQNWSVQE